MSPDAKIAPSLNPEMARLYRRHLLTCRRLGVQPLPRERAHEFLLKVEVAEIVAHEPDEPSAVVDLLDT